MEHEGFLTTIAEVAIAVAGFSGIVAVLGRRSEGDWSEPDRLRLRMLLLISFNTVLLAFLPMFLFAAGLADQAWRVASGICLIYLLGTMVYRFRQMMTVRKKAQSEVSAPLLGFATVFAVTVLILLAVNVWYWATAWPYLLTLLQGLALAFILFVRLLRILWASEQRAA